MNVDFVDGEVSYEIPARRITGSPSQVLEELDDMVDALQIVRNVIIARTPKLARPPRRGLRARLRDMLHVRDHPEPSLNR